ncbi:MAG: hypothetical protein V4773_19995 [Verrucomicrobiota bacterium]
MPSSDTLVLIYLAAGLVVIPTILFCYRKDRKAIEAKAPGLLIFLLLIEPFLIISMFTVLLWPVILLGVFICWLDGKAVDETDDPGGKAT